MTPEEIIQSLPEYLANLIVAVRYTRKQALEEAAKVVEDFYINDENKALAAAIRALKDKP